MKSGMIASQNKVRNASISVIGFGAKSGRLSSGLDAVAISAGSGWKPDYRTFC